MLLDRTIDFGAQFEVGRVDIGNDPWPDRTECVMAFGPGPLPVGFLLIAGGHVIADGVAEDVVDRLRGRHVLTRPADHNRQFAFEVDW